MSNNTYTGRNRQRTTRRSVRFLDVAARWVIVCGGIGTIIAVLTVCLFLLSVVIPLFFPATLSNDRQISAKPTTSEAPLHFGVDEYQLLGTIVAADGSFEVLRLDTGEVIEQREFLKPEKPTAAAFTVDGERAAFGFADGRVRLATFGFTTSFLEDADVPQTLRDLQRGQSARYEDGIVIRTSEGQLRLQTAAAELEEPIDLELSSPIRLIDYAQRPDGPMYCILTENGQLQLEMVSQRENLLTSDVTTSVHHAKLPFTAPANQGPPAFLLLSGQGDNVYVAWTDGRIQRFDAREPDHPQLAEDLDILPQPDRRLTALKFMIGRNTLLAGDNTGRVQALFRTKPENAETPDGALLTAAHELMGPQSAVTSIAPSARSRMVCIGFEDGSLQVDYVTNGRRLVNAHMPGKSPVIAATLSPKDDGLFALGKNEICEWKFNPEYPEATLASLFLPVWYEGYEKPGFTWQSSSGTDDFEPKLSLVPLIYGTLKATFYSMLFGVPLALLAAIYTSEFLSPNAKARIKPSIEMMASLPSVVLGFLAGIVIAPVVENVVPEIIASFVTVPFALLLGAHLWQLLPQQWNLLLAHHRLWFISLALPLGVWLGWLVGPAAQRWLFAGDIRTWLDGDIGNGIGGWMFLLLPVSAVLVAWLVTQKLGPVLRARGAGWSRGRWAALDLVKFLLGTAATIGTAYLAGTVLDAVGWDPRGVFVGTYVQRNALIVGFVMGFAVIPLIYTIADDALSTVPNHLRSASLGAGATPWQTAMRIIIPTAMSGLFSAVMIGLGRAVGETMIVLMAAGNTSIMEINIFNGFQTLSALIATELPEAVRDSTHYRTLFLAALALFVLTFVVNTVAESIRLRFRRRAYEL